MFPVNSDIVVSSTARHRFQTMQNHRPHPHVAIPRGARILPPEAEVYSSYPLELGSASDGPLLNPWDTTTPTARQPATRYSKPPHSRARSALELVPPNLGLQVPDAQIYRSSSQRQTAHEYYHRSSKSDSEYPFEEEYSGGSDLPSPYSPSINLPADEVGFSFPKCRNQR